MRTFNRAVAASAFLAAAAAQDSAATTAAAVLGADGVYTVTEYTSDCSTGGPGGLGGYGGRGGPGGTVTGTITSDLPCDECEHKTGIWTTYTTAYLNTCSTGETSATYTVTESCSGP